MRRFVLATAVLLCLAAPRQRPVTPPAGAIPYDIFSAASPNNVQSIHLSLDLTVDFDAHQLRGSATHRIVHHAAATTFVLDTRDLQIDAVTVDDQPATWSLGTATANGAPLVIGIHPDSALVRVDYHTTPTSQAVHWLNAQQTIGRLAPAVWTDSEPDRGRAWIPVQDTPGARATYDATIHVPPGLLALMSAGNNPTTANDTGVYRFEMDHSIPDYLIALTAGRLQFHALDARIGVYAEPELVDDAAWEMQRTPDLMHAAEGLMGPYPFERYDLAFPPGYGGGMENPNLFQLITNVMPAHMADLDATFHMTQEHSPPVHWQLAIAKTLWAPGLPSLEQFLMRGSHQSLPVWYELGQTAKGRAYAIPIYRQARPFYDPDSQSYIDQVLHFVAKAAA